MSMRTSLREVFLAPLILCGLMVASAAVTDRLAGIDPTPLFAPYFSASLAITFVSVLLSVFWWVLQLARQKADAPLQTVKLKVRERAPYLLLPALIFPLFLASFTATKTAIPFLVGYSWDPFWARADRLIFGDDAWRIAHHLLGSAATRPLEWFYVVVWGIGLIFVMALVPLNASARFTGRFYTAMMLTWFVAGFLLAYVFSSAGPVFAHLVSADRSVQFADMRAVLGATLKPHGPIWTTQLYLPSELHSHEAAKGGGISAMPSMHLGAVAIYVIGAWRTRWLLPAVLMWLIIFVASGFFGYHYWVDGLAAAGIAGLCWAAAKRVASALGSSGVSSGYAHVDDPDGIGMDPVPSAR